MGKVWTAGIAWGILAWVPFFLNWPFVFQAIFGLPVLLTGYLLISVEAVFGPLPHDLGICISLACGIALSVFIRRIWFLSKGEQGKMLEKEVE